MSEHEHRRGGNNEPHRHHRNGLIKWVVTTFMAGLVSGFALLLVWSGGRVAGDAQDALKKALGNERAIVGLRATTVTELKEIKRRLGSIEATQRDILRAVK